MKGIGPDFVNAMINGDGVLSSILERVKQDHTLMLAIREGYINIYYRGGNLLKITERGSGSFSTFFDDEYCKQGHKPSEGLPLQIASHSDAVAWVRAVPLLKEVMDRFLVSKNKPEREFQQLVARENNFSSISNESEYFVSDIEFADSELGARFDMLAIRWLASQRQNGSNCRPAFIEMKYGDNALKGDSGLVGHLKDFHEFITSDRYKVLVTAMEAKFNQLDQLGLMSFNRSSKFKKISIDRDAKPEVVFLLANHNPRSTVLKSILEQEEFMELANSDAFDLRFHVASFSGYAFHESCMKSLKDFKKLL